MLRNSKKYKSNKIFKKSITQKIAIKKTQVINGI